MSSQPETNQRRQMVSFSFYRVQPEWRRLDAATRSAQRHEFCEVVRRWGQGDKMRVLPYSLVGMRPDCEMLLWRICYSLDHLQLMSKELLATAMGAYLETPYSYLAMTKRSIYLIGHEHPGQ